ncbi:MAG TPA: four helix bundle protein [Thermomicrobiales bacterium]|nr:four helix bundle protein [Thermomicrobiales bacterium]
MSGRVERFEDLIAWQKTRLLTSAVYAVTRSGALQSDYGLARQMQRTAVSIMSNIAEGFERSRDGEFHQFLSIAKGSCAELRSQLYIAADVGYVSQDEFQALLGQAEEVARIVGGLRASVDQRRIH